MIKNVVLIAAPGAGKGTLARNIEKHYNLVHISSGSLLREAALKEDETGIRIKNLLERGQFVEDDLIFKILDERLKEDDIKKGYILDGFPRNMEQAKRFDEMSKASDKEIDKVILLNVSKEELIKRVTGRLNCDNCGDIHNIYIPEIIPKVENTCNNCGFQLTTRSDDNEEVFENRYKTYQEKTAPIIEYYRKQNKLELVDSSGSIDNTFGGVKKIFGEN